MNDLPNELLLAIFSCLPLTSLIHARRVNKLWFDLILIAQLPFGRRDLLNLYLDAVASPAFRHTRPQFDPAFNRSQFLSDIEHYCGPCSHTTFHTWILEWPSSAVIGEIWPGLLPDHRLGESNSGTTVVISPKPGLNFIRRRKPPLFIYSIESPGDEEGTLKGKLYAIQQSSASRKTRDWVYAMALHWYSSQDMSDNSLEVYLFGGNGVGETLAGRVGKIGPKQVLTPKGSWVDYLREELERSDGLPLAGQAQAMG